MEPLANCKREGRGGNWHSNQCFIAFAHRSRLLHVLWIAHHPTLQRRRKVVCAQECGTRFNGRNRAVLQTVPAQRPSHSALVREGCAGNQMSPSAGPLVTTLITNSTDENYCY